MRRMWRSPPGTLALVAAVALFGCSDDPVGPEEHEHAEPEGVVLELNGVEIASYDQDTHTWTGQVQVDEGMETDHIDVIFVDHDGDDIQPDLDEFYLEVEVLDDTVAEFEQDTPGEFGGHVHGEMAGTTSIVFRLMHGSVGTGHADFSTVDATGADLGVPVQVN